MTNEDTTQELEKQTHKNRANKRCPDDQYIIITSTTHNSCHNVPLYIWSLWTCNSIFLASDNKTFLLKKN